jgi:phosphoribosylaminoimidazolecarboxamide formyltransferase / IMP cyclohydrolase
VETKYTAADYRHFDRVKIRRALVSVSDKTGLLELAKALSENQVEIVSTGSTAKTIREAGFEVVEVASVTGFQETLDGRVKTLHPGIHAGLLADLRLIDHQRQLETLGVEPFQLVVVNLYPFVQAIESGATGEAAIDQIDIGGPAMVRASAKNHANVAIVVDPARYPEIIRSLSEGGTTLAQRRNLALAAFSHTAQYDTAVANWMAKQADEEWKSKAGRSEADPSKNPGFELKLNIETELSSVLRYGENAHQAAALYKETGFQRSQGIAASKQLGGKDMSYNNFVDADAAVRAAYDFSEPAVAIIKHANPCGIAIASPDATDPIANAHAKAHLCDPLSAYGGVVAANRTVTLEMAKQVGEIFTEVLVAPGFEIEALEHLLQKKNLRILQLPANYSRENLEIRQISGGFLVQEADTFKNFTDKNWTLVSGQKADASTRADLEFAWKACRSVKSNAILLAKEGASIGIGMGQVNRVDSCELAVNRAGIRVPGTVAASDAFFPFKDGLELLIRAGITAVVQPGGSIRDEEVIAAANEAGITMYFTGERHFFH